MGWWVPLRPDCLADAQPVKIDDVNDRFYRFQFRPAKCGLMDALLQDRTGLLDALWHCQDTYGYIRDQDVADCSQALGVSAIDIEGVVSFYHFFHRHPGAKFTVYLNNSIVSQVHGFARVKEAFEKETGCRFGKPDPAGQFALYETACIGLSDQEPAALINWVPLTRLNGLKVKDVVAKLRQGAPVESLSDHPESRIRFTPEPAKTLFFREYRPGTAIRQLKQRTPDTVIDELKRSKLAGMGGAFFPTGMKWDFCRQQPASPKYIVCNADEGEPGTFKDRALLDRLPGLLLEGMVIGGFAIGASEGIIYLRAEYRWLLPRLQAEIETFRQKNLLGTDVAGIDGFDFDIRIQLGAGAYVCGEETALLNSMEGKRGEPRAKNCYPTERGFLNQPTVVNNVETFCAAARIIELGAEFYLNTGTENSPGTKLISVSGDCRNPGIYELEWGTSVATLLDLCEANDPYLVQVSGPSGQCISTAEFDRKFALDDLRCGGSLMIFNSSRDLLEILSNYADFFKHESCGVCTPCRAGNFIVQRKLEKIQLLNASPTDFADLQSWGKIMKTTSRCGLGASATNSLLAAIEKFPEYFQNRTTTETRGIRSDFSVENAVREYDKFSR